MKKSWNIPEILNLIGLLLACLFVWLSGYFSTIPFLSPLAKASTRLYIIGVMLFLWLIRFLIIEFLSRKTNQKFLYALVDGDNTAAQKDKTEQKTLRKSIFLITSALKTKLLFNRHSYKCFVKTPWFLIMGPKNSGKSSALQNADLHPPSMDDSLQNALLRLQQTSETKWSFFKQGIFIELVPSLEKEALPNSLIKLLKKYRHHKPVEGIILSYDITEFLSMDIAARNQTIKLLKQSLANLQSQLGLNLSIYLLFTKCDLVKGFKEYFERENHTEKALGFEIKSSHYEHLCNEFKEHYDSFLSHLKTNLSSTLKRNQPIETYKKIVNFPQQMESLKISLESFVHELFLPENSQKTFFLHGVYFSSSLQQGEPQDYYLPALTNAYKLTYQKPLETEPVSNKPLFLNELFEKHITLNAAETTYNSRTKKLLKELKIATYCVLMVLIVGYGILSYEHYSKELQKIKSVEKTLFTNLDLSPPALEQGETWDSFAWLSSLHLFKTLADTLNISPWPNPSLARHILKLHTSLMNAFYTILDYRLLPLFFYEVENIFQSEKDPNKNLELLKIYLLFNIEDPSKKIVLEKSLKESIRNLLVEYNKTSNKRIEEYMSYLELAFKKPIPSLPINYQLIDTKRQTLDHSNLLNQLYNRLQLYGEQNYPNPFVPTDVSLNFYEVFIQKDKNLFSIPAFYTQQGFNEIFQKKKELFLEQLLRDEQTIALRDGVNDALKETLREQLNTLYAQNYFVNWQNLLTEHSVNSARDLSQLLKILRILTSKDSPLIKILATFQSNVSSVAEFLPVAQMEMFTHLNQIQQAKDNNPPAIQTLLTQLTQLNTMLAPLQAEADPSKAAFALVQTALEKSLAAHPLELLKITASSLPEPINNWIYQIIEDTWEVLLGLTGDYVNKVWQTSLKKPFEQELALFYPFSQEANQDAPLPLFKKFFAPNGEFDQFYKTYLILFEQTKGVPFAKATLGVHKTLIHGLHKIQQLLFDDKGNMNLAFSIEPHTLDKQLISITWTLANQKIEYRHGPLFTTNIQWFTPDRKSICSLSCKDFQGKTTIAKYEGVWSIFKLIDHQSITEPNILNIALGDYKAQFLIQGALLEAWREIRSMHLSNSVVEKILHKKA